MTTMIIKRILLVLCLAVHSVFSTSVSAGNIAFDFEPADEYTRNLLLNLQENQVFSSLQSFVEQNFVLNADIIFSFHNGSSLFFDTSGNRIFVPYSYLVELDQRLKARYPQQLEVQEGIFATALEQLLWFEFGRALVSQYALPITGEEEIALDEFAVLMLLQFNQRAQDFLLDAVEIYLLVDDTRSLLDSASAKKQAALDEQRYRRIVCIILGRDYEPYVEIVEESAWTKERLEQCEEKFNSSLLGWYEALRPALTESSPYHNTVKPFEMAIESDEP